MPEDSPTAFFADAAVRARVVLLLALVPALAAALAPVDPGALRPRAVRETPVSPAGGTAGPSSSSFTAPTGILLRVLRRTLAAAAGWSAGSWSATSTSSMGWALVPRRPVLGFATGAAGGSSGTGVRRVLRTTLVADGSASGAGDAVALRVRRVAVVGAAAASSSLAALAAFLLVAGFVLLANSGTVSSSSVRGRDEPEAPALSCALSAVRVLVLGATRAPLLAAVATSALASGAIAGSGSRDSGSWAADLGVRRGILAIGRTILLFVTRDGAGLDTCFC